MLGSCLPVFYSSEVATIICVRQSNYHAVAVVNLMLDDLRCKAGAGFEARFKPLVLIPQLDRAVSLGLSRAGQGQAALL